MANHSKAFVKIMDGLALLYMYIRINPKSDHIIDILLAYNKALIQMDKINLTTLLFIRNSAKTISRDFYDTYKSWMNRYGDTPCDFEYDKALVHVDGLINANRKIIEKIEIKEFKKASDMAYSVEHYPDYIVGRYKMDPIEFFDKEISYYSDKYDEFFLNGLAKYFYTPEHFAKIKKQAEAEANDTL